MTNLVFDMNNMLFRSMFVISGFSNKYTFDSQRETDELMRKITTDITFLVRLINPSRIIIAKDDRSWRKNINIEENEGYKGTRKSAEHINWDNVYRVLDEFLEIAENNGFIVTSIPTAEADDIIALWRDELLFNKGQHVIMVSGDEDIRQLVASYITNDKKKVWACVFNPFKQGKNAARKLYVWPKHFNEWLNKTEEADIWNMNAAIDVDKGDFRRIVETDDVRVEELYGSEIATRKIFCGDDGDNIPAIYTWISKEKDGTPKIDPKTGEPKVVRLTNAPYEKIIESLKTSPNELIDHYDLMERKAKILQGIRKVAKHEPAFDIEQRLKRQIKLVVLDKNQFPEEIVEKFEEEKETHLTKPRPDISGLNMNTFLQGTRFVRAKQGGSGQGTESSIFKEIDRLSSSKTLF
jgi:5'-3' exonuclease